MIEKELMAPSNTLEEKAELIGAAFLDNFLRYQQRDYAGIQAERRRELRNKQVQQMVKDSPNNALVAKLVSMHNDHNPTESYENMKRTIVKTSAEILHQLDGMNKAEGTNFSIEDCMDKVFAKFSPDELKEYFIEEQKNRGEVEFNPDLMSPNALKEFTREVIGVEARMTLGKEPFMKESGQSEKKDGAPKISRIEREFER